MKFKDLDYNVFAARCPSRAAFEQIFGKWGMLIIARLKEGPARFGEISRAVEGISEKMLSKTLRALVDEGLLSVRILTRSLPGWNIASARQVI